MNILLVFTLLPILAALTVADPVGDRLLVTQKGDSGRLSDEAFTSPDSAEEQASVSSEDKKGEKTRQSHYNIYNGNFGEPTRGRCPLCDDSVYPYCGDKLFHDACCCTDPYEFPLPYKCQYADCAFLHANSCREHSLISNCCCSDEYRSLLRSTGKSDGAPAKKPKN